MLISGMLDDQSEFSYCNKLICSFPCWQSRPGRHIVTQSRNYAKKSATFHGTKQQLFPFSLLFCASSNFKYAGIYWVGHRGRTPWSSGSKSRPLIRGCPFGV